MERSLIIQESLYDPAILEEIRPFSPHPKLARMKKLWQEEGLHNEQSDCHDHGAHEFDQVGTGADLIGYYVAAHFEPYPSNQNTFQKLHGIFPDVTSPWKP